jgi:hypothetical protein
MGIPRVYPTTFFTKYNGFATKKLLAGLKRDANYWVYLGIPMQGNRLIPLKWICGVLGSASESIKMRFKI